LNQPDIASVDVFNAALGTPTLDLLMNYDAVLTWTNNQPYDREAFGNVLADYVDQGGGVVIGAFAFSGTSWWGIGGRIMDPSYTPLASQNSGNHYSSASMEIVNPSHPIMNGVTTATDVYRDYTMLTDGSELVARWNDGENFVAAKGNIVGVNSYFGDHYQYSGDVPAIVHNSLIHVAEERWLTADPTSGTVPAGQSLDLTMTFNAAGLKGGDYYANINVNSNDPDEPTVTVPAHLHVTGAPDIAVDPTALEFGNVFIGYSSTRLVKVSNPGTDVLNVTNISSSESDYTVIETSFSLNPGESHVVEVTFLPSSAGQIAGTLTFESNDPDEPTVEVSLFGVGVPPPEIAVNPDSLFASLPEGQVTTRTLTISNTGESDLTFDISIGSVSAKAVTLEQTSTIKFDPVKYRATPSSQAQKATKDEFGNKSLPKPFTITKQVSSSALNVLIAAADYGMSTIANYLLNQPDIASVDVFNAALGTPTLDQLENYDAVVTWSNYQPYDREALGNVLADYVDQGGGVVIGAFAFSGTSWWGIGGRIMDPSYTPLASQNSGNHFNWSTMEIVNPSHPIMNGVTTATDFYRDYTMLTNGSELVARWNDGENFVAAKGNIVGVNSYFGDSYQYSGDVPAIVHNSLLFVAGEGRWLSAGQTSGTVPAGQSLDITMTFNATNLSEGNYYANVNVGSNDPANPMVTIPAHLRVNEAENLPPSAFRLISPKNFDTLKLDSRCPPIMFSWHRSIDPEGEDVYYSIRIIGPNLDTTTVGLQDTSVALGIMCKLQPRMPYAWSVFATDGMNIVAALDTFIFFTSDSVNAADNLGGKVPEQYTLLQNYPNPFNPSTLFRYALPTRSWVKLEIYNLLGQRVLTLVDQTQDAGYYEMKWNAEVSSGIYFYRLEAVDVSNSSNTFVELKRMILLK
jgi:predicted ester cyclase